jgi:hypothetical protein
MVTVTRSDDYRRSGEACLEMARRARFPQDRAQWLTLAQGWFKLANGVDHRGLAEEIELARKANFNFNGPMIAWCHIPNGQ